MLKYILIFIFFPVISFSQNFLTPDDFEKAIREQQDATLIDLRNVNQYMMGHIKNAHLIDFLRDDFKEYFLKTYPKNTKLFVYSQTSEGSKNVGLYIKELGYQEVTALDGGFEYWIRKSKPYKSTSKNFSPLRYITKENYFQILKNKKWVLILFHEDFCESCDKLEEIFKELKSDNPDIQYVKINYEINTELAEWQKVNRNPTIILYKNGIQYWKTTTIPTKDKIKQQIY